MDLIPTIFTTSTDVTLAHFTIISHLICYKASYFVPWFPPWTLCLDSVRKPNRMILWKCKSDHMSLLAQNPPMASCVTLIKCPTLTLICKAPHSLASWSFSWLHFLIVAWSFSQVQPHGIPADPQIFWAFRPFHLLFPLPPSLRSFLKYHLIREVLS